jgi:hypothetical protein
MEVIAGFRVWQLAFMSAFALLCLVIVLCCIFRCRIPRTKQEIEADSARKKVTKQFSQHLRKIPVDKMELDKVLPEVITLEHHRILKGIKEEKMTFFQKLKKALFSKDDDESSSVSGLEEDIEAALDDETSKDASGDKTPADKGTIKDPDDIIIEEVIDGKKSKLRSSHQEQLLGAIQKLNRIRAVQQQLQTFRKQKKDLSSRESVAQSDQSPKSSHPEPSPSVLKKSKSKESKDKEYRHTSSHPSKTGSREDSESKRQQPSPSKEESIKSRQESKGDSKETPSPGKKTSGLLKPTDKQVKKKKRKDDDGEEGKEVRSHSLESSSLHPLSRDRDREGDSSGGSGSSKTAFLSKQKTCPIIDTTDIVRRDLTYSTFKQSTSKQQSPKTKKDKKQSPKQKQRHPHHDRETMSQDIDIESLKQITEKRKKRMSRQIELTDKDIQVISDLHPSSHSSRHHPQSSSGQSPPATSPPQPPRVSARATQYPSDAVLYEEIGPSSRTTSRPASGEDSSHHHSHRHQHKTQTHRSRDESKSAEHEEERTKF